MKVLITGCNGQVGIELCRQGAMAGHEAIPVDLPDVDITDPESFRPFFAVSDLALVVNAAAYTAVDQAESDADRAMAVNGTGPQLLAQACRDKNIPLIHISTDYVFDGTARRPYREDDALSPIGVYGKSKAAGDVGVAAVLDPYIILRTAWVCSAHGKNFVKTMLRLGAEREELSVVDDQRGCPSFAADIAETIWKIITEYQKQGRIPWGIYNYCGKGTATWFEFAEEIFRRARSYRPFKIRSLRPISSKEYPTPVRRPSYSVLDCRKISASFGIEPKPWQESLDRVIRELCLPESGVGMSG